MVKKGSKAPDFKLPGSDGKEHSLNDYSKKYLVLYFYPRDMTPGCTMEANAFNKSISNIRKLNAEVVGVSNDDLERHDRFSQKCDLDFVLLSDTKNKAIKAYGAYGDRGIFGKGTLRNTYIIKNGKVVAAFEKVNPTNHVNVVLKTLKELNANK